MRVPQRAGFHSVPFLSRSASQVGISLSKTCQNNGRKLGKMYAYQRRTVDFIPVYLVTNPASQLSGLT